MRQCLVDKKFLFESIKFTLRGELIVPQKINDFFKGGFGGDNHEIEMVKGKVVYRFKSWNDGGSKETELSISDAVGIYFIDPSNFHKLSIGAYEISKAPLVSSDI